ncbi:MAG: hypothetical protein EHM12_11220 [Dehalococcoidia bacterium]|nr:MAG: hypothetical protein EHM12_11220 [Dehalococcoidia bacterium]
MLKCKIFHHKTSNFTDSGYYVCERCGAHEYYDNEKWSLNYSVLGKIIIVISKIHRLYNQFKFKINMFFNKDGLPF